MILICSAFVDIINIYIYIYIYIYIDVAPLIFSIGKSRDFIDSVIDFDLRGVGSGLRGGGGL